MQTSKLYREKSQSSLGRKPAGVCLGCGNSLETATQMCCTAKAKAWVKLQQVPSRTALLNPAMGQQQPSTAHQLQPGVKWTAFACSPITLVLVPPLPGTAVQAAMWQPVWVPLGLITGASHMLRWCHLPQLLFSFSHFQWRAQMGYSVSAESNKS